MGFLKKMKAKLEDLNGFLKGYQSKIGGFPPIGERMESMDESSGLVLCVLTLVTALGEAWCLSSVLTTCTAPCWAAWCRGV